MRLTVSPPWLDDFVLASHVSRSRTHSEFYRAAAGGAFHRVASGVYLPTGVWSRLTEDERFLARIHAVGLAARPDVLFSHLSAAALWRLPILGSWPALPEITVGATAGGQTRRLFAARKYPLPSDFDVIDHLRVTTLPRTIIDVARTARMSVAVAMADHALSPRSRGSVGVAAARVSPADLAAEAKGVESSRGMRRCWDVLDLADARSGSPGESLSRVAMHLAGLPVPELQHPVYDSRGLVGITDFWWPQFNLVGEFDGFGKYVREELRAGMSVADVVVAEKIREDRIRATGLGVTRWRWDTAISVPRLTAHLRSAGLR